MTDYLALARDQQQPADGPSEEGNPYVTLVREDQQAQQRLARTVVEHALSGNPEVAAERNRLAKTSGLPLRVVERNIDEVRRKEQARALDLARMAHESPVLARQLTDPAFTTVAVDDLPMLAQVEKTIGNVTRYIMGADQGGGLQGDMAYGVRALKAGSAGIFRMASEVAALPFDFLERVPAIGGNPLRRLAEGFGMIASDELARMKAADLPDAGNIRQGVRSGISSAVGNTAMAPLAFMGPAGIPAALVGMVAQQGGLTYAKDRDEGVPVGTATVHAAADMLAEYVGERYFGAAGFLERLVAGKSATKLMMWEITREVPGEIGTTLWQNFNDWALTNPEKSVKEFIAEQPDAIVQTAIATLVGGAVQTGVSRGALKTAESLLNRQMTVADAGQHAQALAEAMKTAEASVLRERAPEQFREVLNQMANEGQVYVDAAVLNQMPPEVLQQMGNVAAELPAALAANATVAVPLADALTLLPGTPAADLFLQNARSAPDAPSMLEAEEAGKKAGEWLQSEAEKVIQQATDAEAARASSEAVRADLQAQLESTGRYRPAVNEAMSQWAAAFYTTMGARLGLTPQQFYERYPLRILGQASQPGGQVIEQGVESPAFREWFGGSKVVDEAGKPRVMYHGTGADVTAFRAKQAGAIFVTPEPIFAQAYADTGAKWLQSRGQDGAARIMPVYVRAENPFDYENPEHVAAVAALLEPGARDKFAAEINQPDNWALIEQDDVQAAIKAAGFDSFNVDEGGFKNLAVYDPNQIKSAVGNRGTYSRGSDNILEQSPLLAELSPESRNLLIRLSTVARQAFSRRGRSEAVVGQALENGGGFRSESQSDLVEGEALSPEESAFFEGPAVVSVLSEMRRAVLNDAKVLDAVIGAVPIYVVHDFIGEKRSPQKLLRKHPMFKDGPSVNTDLAVTETVDASDPGSLLLVKVATRAAELAREATSAGLEAQKDSAATSAGKGNGLSQNGTSTPTARATFNPSTLEMVLNPSADLSSFFHETGHFFLEVLADIASQDNAPAQIADDMNQVLRWFGVESLGAWNAMTLDQQRVYHERWAESIEQYIMEGRAPSAELAPLMRRFRAWLLSVYKSIKQFLAGRPGAEKQPLNDDIRRVMDRLLATDEQIAQAEAAAGMVPDEEATGAALERQQARSMRDLKWVVSARDKVIKALQRDAKQAQKDTRAQVTAEVEAAPEVRAAKALAEAGKAFEADPVSADFNAAAIADAFGFPSVEAMHRAIDAFGDPKRAIEQRTEQRLLEEQGELVDPAAIRQAANEAVHNEARARALATELAAQSEMLDRREPTGQTDAAGRPRTVNVLMEAAKQFGAQVAARTQLRDLKAKAWAHTAAERRAAQRWQDATKAGKTEEAVQAKRDQVLNNAAAKALTDAQAEARDIGAFFKRVTKGSSEAVVERGRDADIVDAARAVLQAYGVESKASRTAAENLNALRTRDPDTFTAVEPIVAAATSGAQPLAALTVEELQGLHEQVQALWHLAKRSRQMEVDGNLMDIEDAAAELNARMVEIGVPAEAPGQRQALTKADERKRWVLFARAALRRVEQWAEGMDGKYGGPFLRYVFQPVKDAAGRYRAERIDFRRRFQGLVDAVAPHMQVAPIEAPELGYTFGKGHNGVGMAELLHAILHTGNDSNKRKLLLGRGWAQELQGGALDTTQWDAFINRLISQGTLKREHFDFAQGVWDLLESTKAGAQRTHRDVFGYYFDEITANPLTNALGTWRGGYVPAQADPAIVTDADLRALSEMENESMAFSFPTTSKGFTKGRVEYNRPLKLDLRTLPQHIDKVLMFTHMEPAVRSAARLLRQPDVAKPLGRMDPAAYSGMLLPWLNRSARQQVETPMVGDGRLSRVASALRSRAGAALMFANISNTVQQVTGLATAMVKVKPTLVLAAAAEYIAHPRRTAQAVAAASTYMDGRMRDEIAALHDELEQIVVNPSVYENAQRWSMRHAYFLQQAFDNVLGPIVWTGAYNQAVAEGLSEADAVRFADGTVRQTQGSTLPEDISRMETGNPVVRMFTQFTGYFNMLANTNATAVQQIASEMGLRKGAGKALYVLTMGMLMPLWIAEAIAQAFKGGPGDEDKDGEYLDDWIAAVLGMGTIKGLLAAVPGAGQVINAGIARWNNNPADDRISMSPAVSLLEGSAGAAHSVYKAIVDDANPQRAVRDVASFLSVVTGLPVATALARPAGYAAGVAADKIDPTSPADAARGLVTGVASPDSKQR